MAFANDTDVFYFFLIVGCGLSKEEAEAYSYSNSFLSYLPRVRVCALYSAGCAECALATPRASTVDGSSVDSIGWHRPRHAVESAIKSKIKRHTTLVCFCRVVWPTPSTNDRA